MLIPAVLAAQCYSGTNILSLTAANTIVNTYYPGTASVTSGSKTITVGTSRGASNSIQAGDILLVIQMQGANINSTNSDSYGDGVSGGNASGELSSGTIAGQFEYAVAVNAVGSTGGTIRLATPLKNSYTNTDPTSTTGAFRFQVVRVPNYSSITFVLAGSLTGSVWNGTSGGVVAIDAGTITNLILLGGGTLINASGIGFRGGAGRQLTGIGSASGYANTDYRTLASADVNAAKGEGTAGAPRYLRTTGTSTIADYGSESMPNGSSARGAPGTAGGGGTDGNPPDNSQNSGGGGGANGGAGGKGGNSWFSSLDIGGFGGAVPSYLSKDRLLMGGGGGAGTSNNGGIVSSGAAGGGIVLLRVDHFASFLATAPAAIYASGSNADVAANDGGGGGGAGGTIYVTVRSGNIPLNLQANGGNGGNSYVTATSAGDSHGPGGGGGGGVIRTNAAFSSGGGTSVLAGTHGVTTTGNRAFGSTDGSAGTTSTNLASNSLPNSPFCDIDDDDDGIPDNLEYVTATYPTGVYPLDDNDNDGIPNAYDPTPGTGLPAWTDANSDGLNDFYDADRDGIPNSLDLDSDNDGIPDLIEAGGTDSNGDGIADVLTDTDNDGLSNTYDTDNGGTPLSRPDTDADGIPNFRDRDSDNDGIADLVEAGGADTNGDGVVDDLTDADADGLANTYDNTTGGTRIALLDTDGDGYANYRDLDADNDGIPDIIEAGAVDATNNGTVDLLTDSDGDGFVDAYDGDANNDGTAENTAGALIITGAAGGTGVPVSYPRANFDGTGLPNPYDLDADGDGINDVREAGFAVSSTNGLVGGTIGTNGWSLTISVLSSLGLLNSDTDLLPDYRDIDSDNDGITDNVEYQSSSGYVAPSGSDSDGDGIDNSYDGLTGFGDASDPAPNNHDSVDLPDYRDSDSDNDVMLDIIEGNDFNGNGNADDLVSLLSTDADNDGLDDRFDQQTGPVVTVAGYLCPTTPTSCPAAGSKSTVQKTPTGATNRDWRNSLFALPVTLISFSGQESSSVVTLRWTVEDEQSLKEYVVERSVDGNRFTPVATVAARGLIERQNYQTTDNIAAVSANPVYYRLQMVDIDGNFKYSSSIRISIGGRPSNAVRVTPNPVNAGMQVRISSAVQQMAQITIVNAQGQFIYQLKQQVYSGENNVAMGQLADRLPRGSYLVKVVLGKDLFVVKFVK